MAHQTWFTDLSANDLRAIADKLGPTRRVNIVSLHIVTTELVRDALTEREQTWRASLV